MGWGGKKRCTSLIIKILSPEQNVKNSSHRTVYLSSNVDATVTQPAAQLPIFHSSVKTSKHERQI